MKLDAQLNMSDRETRETISKNFKEIQSAYDDLDRSLDQLNIRLDNLDEQKATHDDLQTVNDNLQNRINHLYAGDPQTIKAVVTEILEEKGVI